MHGIACASICFCCALGAGAAQSIVAPAAVQAATIQAIDKAREALKTGDGRTAVRELELLLERPQREARQQVLPLLRESYEAGIRQATKEGRLHEVEHYRVNLAILTRARFGESGRLKVTPSEPAPTARELPSPPLPAKQHEVPQDLFAGSSRGADEVLGPGAKSIIDNSLTSAASSDSATHREGNSVANSAIEPKNQTLATPATRESSLTLLEQADQAFDSKRYEEAGAAYARLADAGQLPENHRDRWAYCRRSVVVKRINDKPKSRAEWDAILAEIELIRKTATPHWYDEYLRSLALELSGQSNPPASRRPVVRGAQPDEPESRAKSKPATSPDSPGLQHQLRKAGSTSERSNRSLEHVGKESQADLAVVRSGRSDSPGVARPQQSAPQKDSTSGVANDSNWQVLSTRDFLIYHADDELARRAAAIAEATRDAQLRRWNAEAPRVPWDPPCHLYLYPTAEVFSIETRQPPQSPGFSTTGLLAGRVTARRINLRADHAKLLTAVLPHEVTHIVLADLFPEAPIPRWADEGMAAMAEPEHEQRQRAIDLAEPLQTEQLFSLRDLMTLDYPENNRWPLYYSQSISITRFLVERGGPGIFLRFLRDSQQGNLDRALQTHFKIDNLQSLQTRWLEYAADHARADD